MKLKNYMLVLVGIFFFSMTSVSAITFDNIVYWNFDEASGTNVEDVTDREHNGTLINGGVRIPGVLGNAISLDGIDDYLNFTVILGELNSSVNASFSFWINLNSTPDDSGCNSGSCMGILWGGGNPSTIHNINVESNLDMSYDKGTGASELSITATNSNVSLDSWHHVVITSNGTIQKFYIDGSLTDTITGLSNHYGNWTDTKVGAINPGGSLQNHLNGSLDEFGIWNRVLTAEDVSDLYNGGLGLPYGSSLVITLNHPVDDSIITDVNVTFNATLTPLNFNLTNATLYVWYSNGTIFNQTTNVLTGTVANNTVWNVSNFVTGNYDWNVFGCAINASGTVCQFEDNNLSFQYGVVINENIFNGSTFETQREGFWTNISLTTGDSISSLGLYYDDTRYDATATLIGGSEYVLSTSIDVPSGVADKSWFWSLNLNNGNTNLTSNTQEVNLTQLAFCNTSLTNQYINFTFKDEVDDTDLEVEVDSSSWTFWLGNGEATKTYTFSNTTGINENYPFCGSPPHLTINTDLSFKYSNTSYPQRTFALDNEALTNSTTNQVLYLLKSADGIYSSIQVTETSSSPITDVFVTIEKQIDGSWVTLEGGNTDSSGLVTFWVSPNFDHRITATKAGFTTTQVTIRPSQTVYTLILTRTGDDSTYNGTLKGMKWVKTPATGRLDPGTEYLFEFNLTASLNNLDGSYCRIELVNESSSVLTSATGGNSGGCNISVTYTPTDNTRVFGRYSIDTTETASFVIIDADSYWLILETDIASWTTLKSFFEDLKDLPEFGDGLRQEYSRVVFFFIMLTILIGMLTFFTGYDFSNPGSAMLVVLPIVLIASVAGFFEFSYLTQYSFLQKHGVAIIAVLFTGGYLFNYLNRNS